MKIVRGLLAVSLGCVAVVVFFSVVWAVAQEVVIRVKADGAVVYENTVLEDVDAFFKQLAKDAPETTVVILRAKEVEAPLLMPVLQALATYGLVSYRVEEKAEEDTPEELVVQDEETGVDEGGEDAAPVIEFIRPKPPRAFD